MMNYSLLKSNSNHFINALAALLFFLLIIVAEAKAQSYSLKSNTDKPFSLRLHTGAQGQGALVQYIGQKEIIPLRLKSLKNNVVKKNSSTTFIWEEIYRGKVTGSYGLTKTADQISNIWYQRNKDGKRFVLSPAVKPEGSQEDDKVLLHNALVTFNSSVDDNLTIKYPNGKQTIQELPGLDNPNASRNCLINDYNFDGYQDLAFSIPDAGMGVYRIFSIWLYNPASKRFEALKEPDYSKSKCSELCDVTIDPKKKLLYSACRGGARWWQDVYKFDKNKKIIWVKSSELTNP